MPVAPIIGQTFSLSGQTGTAAKVKANVAAFRTAFMAAGLVQTADTGQVDWTGTIPFTSYGNIGYEIWRLSDALQATKPVFIRLHYSYDAYTQLQINIQVGTATDGAGVIGSAPNTGTSHMAGGQRQITGNYSSGGNSQTQVRECHIYGDGSGVVVTLFPDAWLGQYDYTGGFFWVERTRDLDGTPNGDGFIVGVIQPAGADIASTFAQAFVFGTIPSQPTAVDNRFPVPDWNYGNTIQSGIVGTTAHVLPVLLPALPGLGGPSALLVAPYRNDFPPNGRFTVSHYGASRQFVRAWGQGASVGLTGSNRYTVALRVT